MDFLGHPVRSASSTLLILIFLGCGHSSIDWSQNKAVVRVRQGDIHLKQNGNTLYYKDEPFTGIIYSLSSKPDTTSIEMFSNGREDGMARLWDANGNKIEERFFRNGKRLGIHTGWHSNGKLRFRYSYKNDLMDGLAEEWFADGSKYREMHYVRGHEEGMQKMWAEDGTIRANYQARNGRNYGLTGIKSCKNIWKDVEI